MNNLHLLHSIAITNRQSYALGSIIEHHINVFKKFHPEAKHILWDHNRIRTLIRHNFEKDVLDAYDQLVPFAYKADLARLCVLYIFGGIYADLSLLFLGSLSSWFTSDIDTALFRLDWNPGSVHNALIYSKPRSDVINGLISQLVANVKLRYYGKSELDPTGPEMISKYICDKGPFLSGLNYENVKLCLPGVPLQLFYVLSEDRVQCPVAIRYKPFLGGAGIKSLGAVGFDAVPYTFAWYNKEVYAN
jgi:hypothetical protein